MGAPEPFKAVCKSSQILSVNDICFGWAAITIPTLSGMLPNTMQRARKALTIRKSDLDNHFTGVLHP
jgi:hypothetical protein